MIARGRSTSTRRRNPVRTSRPALIALAGVAAAAALVDPKLVIAAVMAGAMGIAILEKPSRGGLLVVAIVPVTSGFQPGLGVPGLRLAEVIVLGVAVLVLLSQGSLAGPGRSVDALLVLLVGLNISLGGLHVALRDLGPQPDVVGSIFGPVQWLLIVRIVARTLTTSQLRLRAVWLLLAMSIPTSVLACMQQLDIGPARQIVTSLTDPGLFDTWTYLNFPRATGPFPSWHTLAGYLVVVLVVALVALIDGTMRLSRRLVTSALAAGSAALVLSQTFTALFVVGAATIYLVLRRRRTTTAWWLVAGAVAVVSILGGSLSDRVDQQIQGGPNDGIVPQTIAYRFEVWADEYAPLVAAYWATGFGPGLPDSVAWDHTESGFITLLLRGGLPLLALGMVLMVAIYRRARQGLRGPPRSDVDGGVCLAVLLLTIAQIPLNLIWPYFTNSGMAQPFWVLVGLMLAGDVSPGGKAAEGQASARSGLRPGVQV